MDVASQWDQGPGETEWNDKSSHDIYQYLSHLTNKGTKPQSHTEREGVIHLLILWHTSPYKVADTEENANTNPLHRTMPSLMVK